MRNEEGYVTVLFCFIILIVLAIGGLLVDAGMAMVTKTKLDHATEIAAGQAAKNGYELETYELTGSFVLDQDLTRSLLSSYLSENIREGSFVNILFKPAEPNAVYVTTKAVYKTHFMKLFGVSTITIRSNVKGYVYEEPSSLAEEEEVEGIEVEESDSENGI